MMDKIEVFIIDGSWEGETVKKSPGLRSFKMVIKERVMEVENLNPLGLEEVYYIHEYILDKKSSVFIASVKLEIDAKYIFDRMVEMITEHMSFK